MNKKIISMVLVVVMFISLITPYVGGSAEVVREYDGYVYFTVERVTLGQGLVVEPVKVGFYKEDSLAHISERVLGEMSTYEGELQNYYLQAIIDGGVPNGWSISDIPATIVSAVGGIDQIGGRATADTLANNDYTSEGCWLFALNNKALQMGAGQYFYQKGDYSYTDGDVIQLQYSIYEWGMDTNTGDPSWGTPLDTFSSKENLIRAVADYAYDKTNEAYQEALGVLSTWAPSANQIEVALEALELEARRLLHEKASMDLDNVLNYLSSNVTNPEISAVGGDWTVFSLARGDSKQDSMFNQYLANVIRRVKTIGTNKLSATKGTENSRVVLALTSIGANPKDVAGYNLLEPLTEYDYVTQQGVTGAIYALLALYANGYTYEDSILQELIAFTLENACELGGWSYTGKQYDIDLTAMAITALAPYYGLSDAVSNAIDRALNLISSDQCLSGGFSSYGVECSESAAQVVCALSELGINVVEDNNYIKNRKTVLDALLSYVTKSGAFAHTGNTTDNQIATEQAAYALVAYNRLASGGAPLYSGMATEEIVPKYDMEKVNALLTAMTTPMPTSIPNVTPSVTPTITPTAGPTETSVQSFTKKGLKYKVTKKREVQCIGFVKKTPKAAVIIPATVKNNGVLYRVTSIRKNAFFGQSTLKKITVQSKLVSIGDKAFSGIHKKAVFRCKTKVIRNNTKKLLTKKKGFRKTMKIK